MIPSSAMRPLLKALLRDLLTQRGEPDYQRFATLPCVEKHFGLFLDLLWHADEDLGVILMLLEKDPQCLDPSPIRRLQVLVDYVYMTCALYQVPTPLQKAVICH